MALPREIREHVQQLREERDAAHADIAALRDRLTGDQRAAHDELTSVRSDLAEANSAVATAQAAVAADRRAHKERLIVSL